MTDRADDREEANEDHDPDREDQPTEHLDDIDDGAGCTEIWDHLSHHRDDD